MIKFRLILIIMVLIFSTTTHAQTNDEYAVITPENVVQIVQIDKIGNGYINDIAESPVNDDMILAGSLGLWQYDKTNPSVPPILINGEGSFERVAYHPNGTRFATLSTLGIRIEMWDAERSVYLYRLWFSEKYYRTRPNFLEFSPDGTKLVTGSGEYIVVWDVATSSVLHVLEYPDTMWVSDVAFSKDSKRLIASYTEYMILVWDLETGTMIEPHILTENPSFLCMAYSPNNELIAMAGYRDWLRVWNDDTGDVLWVMNHDLYVPNDVPYTINGDMFSFTQENSICSSRNFGSGRWWSFVDKFAINDGGYVLRYDTDASLQLFNIYTNQPIATFPSDFMNPVLSLNYRPDGAQMALVLNNGFVLIRNMPDGDIEQVFKEERNFTHPDSPEIGLIYSRDSSYLMMTDSNLSYPSGLENSTLVWDTRTWSLIDDEDVINRLRYSPDGQHFITREDDNILVWDILTGEFVLSFQLEDDVRFYRFMPNSLNILTFDNEFDLWNVQTGEHIKSGYRYFRNGIGSNGYAAVIHGVGEQLAVLDNMTIYLFQDMSDNEGIVIESVGDLGYYPALKFSPDGQLFAYSLRSDIAIANAYTGELLHTLIGHHGRIMDIEFHPDGSQIISASKDGTVRIWGIPQ